MMVNDGALIQWWLKTLLPWLEIRMELNNSNKWGGMKKQSIWFSDITVLFSLLSIFFHTGTCEPFLFRWSFFSSNTSIWTLAAQTIIKMIAECLNTTPNAANGMKLHGLEGWTSNKKKLKWTSFEQKEASCILILLATEKSQHTAHYTPPVGRQPAFQPALGYTNIPLKSHMAMGQY